MVSGLIGISHTHSMYGGFTPSAYRVVPSLGVVTGKYPQIATFRGPDSYAGNWNARANKLAALPDASINQGEESLCPSCVFTAVTRRPPISTETALSCRKVTPWLTAIFRSSWFS